MHKDSRLSASSTAFRSMHRARPTSPPSSARREPSIASAEKLQFNVARSPGHTPSLLLECCVVLVFAILYVAALLWLVGRT